MGKADDWQPKASICLNAVAVNTNLQHNDGNVFVMYEFVCENIYI